MRNTDPIIRRRHGGRRAPAGRRRGRGGVYVFVLGTAMLVTLLGLSALAVGQLRARTSGLSGEQADARAYAQSAVEIGRLMIKQDPAWRTNLPQGVWVQDRPIGAGRFTLEAIDPGDGDLTNRPHDPLVLRATGYRGRARETVEVTLEAKPKPLPLLKNALYTAGMVQVNAGQQVGAKTVATAGRVNNAGTIQGNVEAGTVNNTGTVTGSITTGVAAKALPGPDPVDLYSRMGTVINTITIDQRVLGPGVNPWGQPNPEGVYVIRQSGDVRIRRSRIHGTLVVILSPGYKLLVEDTVLLHPARPDYPVLVVEGDAVFQHVSTATNLSEATQAFNFNPAGAPYQGLADTDQTDTYPSEIQGLVHVRGTVKFLQTGLVRGAVVCESAATATPAVEFLGSNEIVYTNTLWTDPPQGYTASVDMNLEPGSWKRITR